MNTIVELESLAAAADYGPVCLGLEYDEEGLEYADSLVLEGGVEYREIMEVPRPLLNYLQALYANAPELLAALRAATAAPVTGSRPEAMPAGKAHYPPLVSTRDVQVALVLRNENAHAFSAYVRTHSRVTVLSEAPIWPLDATQDEREEPAEHTRFVLWVEHADDLFFLVYHFQAERANQGVADAAPVAPEGAAAPAKWLDPNRGPRCEWKDGVQILHTVLIAREGAEEAELACWCDMNDEWLQFENGKRTRLDDVDGWQPLPALPTASHPTVN